MPFCTRCGHPVTEIAAFCAQCGAAQPRTASPAPPLSGLSDRAASTICYLPVIGVIPAIVILATDTYRHRNNVRFDAFQSLYLFVASLILSSAAPGFLALGTGDFALERTTVGALKLLIFGAWIYLLVKTRRGEPTRLPIIGDLAARSAAEQR